jgi:hypothetical protein
VVEEEEEEEEEVGVPYLTASQIATPITAKVTNTITPRHSDLSKE